MDEKRFNQIVNRVERLEKAVFGGKDKRSQTAPVKSFSGLKGGLHFLLSRGFFKTKRALAVLSPGFFGH
jgi:hypothetical protein